MPLDANAKAPVMTQQHVHVLCVMALIFPMYLGMVAG